MAEQLICKNKIDFCRLDLDMDSQQQLYSKAKDMKASRGYPQT